MYGIQLWGCNSNTNISIIQRSQNMMLKTIADVPWFITNTEVHEHLEMSTVREEIRITAAKYMERLAHHPNQLALNLVQPGYQETRHKNTRLEMLVANRTSCAPKVEHKSHGNTSQKTFAHSQTTDRRSSRKKRPSEIFTYAGPGRTASRLLHLLTILED